MLKKPVVTGGSLPRIALYSHDTCGLGHVRRNLLIAQALSSMGADILMISGAAHARAFAVPPGVDLLTLPALLKKGRGRYSPRQFSFGIDDLIAMRSRTITAMLEAFCPDLFVVDNVPLGAMGELVDVLEHLRRRTDTRCVLGLRDVLDDPAVVAREWKQAGNFAAIRAYYDAVWIYGDPAVYDAASAYDFPADVRDRVTYTGYLDQRKRWTGETGAEAPSPDGPFSMCVVGGGQDGMHLARQYAAAPLPEAARGLLVTGPFMGAEDRAALERMRHPRLHLTHFLSEPTALYRQADRVVSMGGYNTVYELLSFGQRPLIVPRIHPRREQYIRARRLADLGLVDVLHPEDATPSAIGAWLRREPPPPVAVHECLDMNGLDRIVEQVRHLLAPPLRLAPLPQPARNYAAC